MNTKIIFLVLYFFSVQPLFSQNTSFNSNRRRDGCPLSAAGKSCPLYVSSEDFPGVIRACTDLQTDIGKVTDALPELITGKIGNTRQLVIAGTLGKSPVIDRLVKSGKLDAGILMENGKLSPSR